MVITALSFNAGKAFRGFVMKINSSARVTQINKAKKLAEKREMKHYHPITGYRFYLTVEGAAYRINCSTRRVRQLLQGHRLMGCKLGKDWIVKWPLMLQVGTRGPVSSAFARENRGFHSEAY